MAMIGKVLRMRHREKKSVREIVKATSLARNTVRKYLRLGKAEAPKYRRPEVPGKLAPFVEAVQQALLADARRPKKERRTAKALHAQLAEAGYEGGYSRLTDYIRAWRAERGGVQAGDAYVPLSFELGEAFQFDWSEEPLVIGGVYQRLQVAHTKLCASRAFWLVAYPSQGHEMLFDAHTRAFTALGGVARRGIYDNMRTAVDRVGKGKARDVNLRFTTMCAHYLFDADFCNVASGWEKGVVEKNVQDSRRRIWLDARDQRFSTLDELNAWLAERCRALWAELRHPEHKPFSVAEMLELERQHLMPMPAPFDGYVQEFSRVSSTCAYYGETRRAQCPQMRHPECFKAASHGIQPGRRDPLLPFESTPTTTARQRERSPAVERGIDADGQFVPFATGGLKAS
jgi:transposase